jgi:hypothetical protein
MDVQYRTVHIPNRNYGTYGKSNIFYFISPSNAKQVTKTTNLSFKKTVFCRYRYPQNGVLSQNLRPKLMGEKKQLFKENLQTKFFGIGANVKTLTLP